MRKSSLPLAAVALCVAFLTGCANVDINSGGGTGGSTNDPSGPPPQLALSSFATGLNAPVGFEIAPNDPLGRIFIVEQGGRIRVIQSGVLQAPAFLDITNKLESGDEKGLLGLAFHPNFSGNSKFYVHYTRRQGTQLQSVIAEYAAFSSASSSANAASELILPLEPSGPVNQPFDNHNGGQLAFGPDSLLYIALGDGGGSNDDAFGNGQNRNSLLGKILRVGVNPFFIPPDNPFVGVPNTRPEIWAHGLRNPWRFSFDRTTGRLFAGDVGQNAREEVDLITRGGNFGWRIMEGSICRPPTTGCNMANLILPITDYDHSAAGGSSVIGGFVYRGTAIPALVGTYVFGDLSSGHVWGLKQDSTGAWIRTVVLDHSRTVSAFGQDAAGELYLVDYANGAASSGGIFRLVAAP